MTFSVALVTILAAVTGMARQADSADVVELTRLERIWNESHVEGNADALERLWADDLIVTVPAMPVMSKKDALAIVRAGRLTFEQYETSDTRIRVYSDAAVVTGRLQRVRRVGDRIARDVWNFTKAYVRRDGRWQVVSWHASDVAREH